MMRQEIELVRQIQGGSIKFPEQGRKPPEPATGISHGHREIAVGDLAFLVVAALRRQPHISNVLTHISGANWQRVEQALCAILDPLTASGDLCPLARNIVDLMCADRGVTGRIMKPYFRDLLARILSPHLAALLTDQVSLLFLEFEFGSRSVEEAFRRLRLSKPSAKRGSGCHNAAAYPRG
jgi:hypothetical protein